MIQQTCRNEWCKQPFEVTDEDLAFYDKMSPVFNGKKELISPPSFCPSCRMQRRMSFRNQIYVYVRPSAKTGKQIFSMFDDQSHYKPIEDRDWWSDDWDPCEYGREFDFSRPFFDQWYELLSEVPHYARSVVFEENSDYSNNGSYLKNCYFCFHTNHTEDCMYCENANGSKSCIECTYTINSELCYDCTWCTNCYNLQSSQYSENCSNSFLLKFCRSCTDCFGCANMQHAQYCIFNEQKTKEEYHEFISRLHLGSFTERKEITNKVHNHYLQYPVPHAVFQQVESVSGNCIQESKDVHDSFFVTESESIKNCFSLSKSKDCQDVTAYGFGAELFYECMVCGGNSQSLRFCYECFEGASDLLYCDSCTASAHCFGCVSLKKKKYCILNKPYSKEEYEQLMPRIIQHLKENGEWSECLPFKFSPIAYNHSLAQRYFPLSKEEALAKGFRWIEQTIPEAEYAIEANQLPDTLPESDSSIIVRSALSGRPFKITTQEIKWYRRLNVPLPRLTYDERMEERAKILGTISLYERPCMKTGVPLKTNYSPDSPWIVWSRDEWEKEYRS